MVEYYFTDGVQDIIKDFLIDWKSAWQKNITKTNLSKKTYSDPLNPRKK